MTAEVVRMPLRDSPIALWVKAASAAARDINYTAANVWVIKNVPSEFRDFVLAGVRANLENTKA